MKCIIVPMLQLPVVQIVVQIVVLVLVVPMMASTSTMTSSMVSSLVVHSTSTVAPTLHHHVQLVVMVVVNQRLAHMLRVLKVVNQLL